MKMNVYIVGFDKTYASSLTGIMDIFYQANQLFMSQDKQPNKKELKVNLVSIDGKPILCQNNILINVHCAMKDIKKADIIIITPILDVESRLSKYLFMIDWLKEH